MAAVVTANGIMPPFPAGSIPPPPFEYPDEFDLEVRPFYDGWPDQQPLLNLLIEATFDFEFSAWMTYTMKSPYSDIRTMVEANTWFPITAETEAAYNAPFPRQEYMPSCFASGLPCCLK